MRILHILDHSAPLQSGYTFRTLGILRAQRALGWDTAHLTSPKQGAATALEEEVDGLRFYRTAEIAGTSARWPIVAELRLMRALGRRIGEVSRAVTPDILHAHSPVLNAIPALRAGRRSGLPVVYEVRALWEDAAVDHGTAKEWGPRYRATRRLETYALEHADAVVTICAGLRSELMDRGIPAGKITVVPNAVDLHAFEVGTGADPELRGRLGLDGARVLGFIGSFYAYEGLELLVRALPGILGRAPDVRVLLVGGGPQERHLRQVAAETGVQDRVIFTGRIPHQDVPRYYDIVDILVYPRLSMRLTELVTPLKPLEAMARGRLLVASDVGGHRELIRDGETGVLFRSGSPDDLAARVLELLGSEGRWPALRAAARRYVEQERSWAAVVPGYRDAYLPLVERARGVVGKF
jgi:PEP-CTERM/exosortase A-associated glycosyltransferase